MALEEGQVFVVADGFDELIDPVLRQRVMLSINDFARRYPRVPVLVTTRPFAKVHHAFPGFAVATIAPWDKSKARNYLEKLAAARGRNADISGLLDWLRKRGNLDVIGTPLGLQFLLSEYWHRNEIPPTFTLLMEGLIEEIASVREAVRGISAGDDDLRIPVERIAFAMQSNSGNRTTITRRDIHRALRSALDYDKAEYVAYSLTSLRAGSGFMRPIGEALDGEYLFAFLHTAYREHLAASHLARMDPDGIVAVMQSHFADSSWEAVFVTALELGIMWRGRRFLRDVESAAAGEPGLRQAIRSWSEAAGGGPGSGTP